MKNSLDAVRHQRGKEINVLARLVVEKDFSMERVKREIELLWPGRTGRDREHFLSMVIEKCHENVWPVKGKASRTRQRAFIVDSDHYAAGQSINRCFAMRLYTGIMESIEEYGSAGSGDQLLSEAFYRRCAAGLLDEAPLREKDDPELMVICLKQMVIILKSAGFIRNEGGVWRVSGGPAQDSPYERIFASFWNHVRWEDIFPSIPDAAIELKRNRGILLDIMMRRSGSFRIDSIAREFFDLTGFCGSDDIVLISFLDFYFFSWLEHFALLEYEDSKEGPVTARITGHGRRFLTQLQGF